MTSAIEERRAERVRSLLRARILFNKGNSTVDCTIRNMSPTGAKIAVSSTISIPDAFDLEVPQKGKTYRALLRWRGIDAIGVEFAEEPGSEAGAPSSRVEHLEQENRKLKARVAALTRRLQELGQDVSFD